MVQCAGVLFHGALKPTARLFHRAVFSCARELCPDVQLHDPDRLISRFSRFFKYLDAVLLQPRPEYEIQAAAVAAPVTDDRGIEIPGKLFSTIVRRPRALATHLLHKYPDTGLLLRLV